MRVGGESEIHLGAQQLSPVGRLDFIEVGGVLTADLPLTIEGTSTPVHLRGKAALNADAVLNHHRGEFSEASLSLVLGIPREDVGAVVRDVAVAARPAGITISRDPSRGDIYTVGFKGLQSGKQRSDTDHSATGARSTSRGWRGIDGSPVSPGWGPQRGRIPNSGK